MWFQEYLLHPSVLTIWGSDEDLTPLSQAKVFFTVRSMGQRKVSFYVPFWEKSLRIGRVNSGNQECPLCLIIFDPITALITTCRDVCLREKAFSFVRVWRLRSTLYLVPYDWKHGLWSSHMCVTWELVGMWTWHGQALFLVHCYILMDWSSARYIEGIQWMREWMSSGRAERWSERMFDCRHVADKGGWMNAGWMDTRTCHLRCVSEGFLSCGHRALKGRLKMPWRYRSLAQEVEFWLWWKKRPGKAAGLLQGHRASPCLGIKIKQPAKLFGLWNSDPIIPNLDKACLTWTSTVVIIHQDRTALIPWS